ncbi:hypothetical protein PVAP13_2NG084500 [Panicum virgatum]|uniref:Uncharacterized protein n=1 Tax=Panicum virgatum TaxID=38727 RepID=A0A8T0VAZ7_PANVG|nr:hypothetical protein PVAP13_2NG084500 [Panicum virgatum]
MFSRLGLGSSKFQVPPNHLKEIRFPHPTLVRVLRRQRECRRPGLPSPTSCAAQLLRCLPTLGILIGVGGRRFRGVVAGTTVVATGLDAGRHLVVGSMAPRVATPRVGAAMPSIVDVVMVSAGIMGSILEEVSRKGAARVLVEVGIHRDSMCQCLEGRELAETSQQGAQKNLQQHQQPQQQTDQGNLKKRRPFCFRCK